MKNINNMTPEETKAEAQRIREMFMPYACNTEWDDELGYIDSKNIGYKFANQCAIKHVEGLIKELDLLYEGVDNVSDEIIMLKRGSYYERILEELKQFKP